MPDDLIKKVPVVSTSSANQATFAAAATSVANTSTQTKDDPDDGGDDPYDDVKKEIRTRYELLPEDIKQAIMDDNYQMKLFEIGKANKLTYEELGSLEMETTMVLLGMTRPTEFRDELQLELKKNDAEIDALVTVVNEQVFTPIRASLDRVYAAKKDPADYIPESITTGFVAKPVAQTPAPMQTASSILLKPENTTVPTATTPKPITPVAAPSLTAQEKSVLENTGVVIRETAPITPASPMTMPSRNDLMKGIENPTKAPSAGFVSDRLKASTPVVPAAKVTDYTVAKPQTPAVPAQPFVPAAPKGPDPYREPLN